MRARLTALVIAAGLMVPVGTGLANGLCESLASLPTVANGCCPSQEAKRAGTDKPAEIKSSCCCALEEAPATTTSLGSYLPPAQSVHIALAAAPQQLMRDVQTLRSQLSVTADARGPPTRSLLALRTCFVI